MKITKTLLLEFRPCWPGETFLKSQRSLRSAWNNCDQVEWMLWALSQLHLMPKPIARRFACDCAWRVLPIFEKERPKDSRPHRAIEFAEKMIKQPRSNPFKVRDVVALSIKDCGTKCVMKQARLSAFAAYHTVQGYADTAAWYAADYARQAVGWANKDALRTEHNWQCDHLRELINPFKKR